MATFTFNKTTNRIEIASPDTFVTAQEVYNKIRRWEVGDETGNDDGLSPGVAQMDLDRIIDNASTGKLAFDATLTQGIIFVIRPPWLIQFEARGGPGYTECGITEGAILSFEFQGGGPDLDFNTPRFPFAATAFVSTSREKDSTPSIRAGSLPQADIDAVTDAVWDEVTTAHGTPGTFGQLVSFLKTLLLKP